MKQVLRWPGSKWRIADFIISHMPPHEVYLEPFFGSGAIFFRKQPARTETINDLDSNVVTLFRVIRDKPEELAALVEMTPWARDEYYGSYEPTGNEVEDARRFLVRCWQGFGAKTACRTGWAFDRTGTVYKPQLWNTVPERIMMVAGRLKNAQIENMPAKDLIQAFNRPNCLIYVDPPYLAASRRNTKLYAVEMGGDDEHRELLQLLNEHAGPVIISGYRNDLYDKMLAGWDTYTVKARTEKGIAASETIWLNRNIAGRLLL